MCHTTMIHVHICHLSIVPYRTTDLDGYGQGAYQLYMRYAITTVFLFLFPFQYVMNHEVVENKFMLDIRGQMMINTLFYLYDQYNFIMHMQVFL